MRMLLVFVLMVSVQFGSCLEVSEIFNSIDKQDRTVVSLLSETQDFFRQNKPLSGSQIIDRYNEIVKETITMVENTKKVLNSTQASGSHEMMSDIAAADVDMLYCAMINNVGRVIKLNGLLQQHADDPDFKKHLEEQLQKIKEELNN